jgi:hypothetical protein
MSGLPPRFARLIRQDVQSMHAYAVQDATGMVKLDAMENPHRLPEHLQAELGRRLGPSSSTATRAPAWTTCARRWPATPACPTAVRSCWAMARTN